MATTKPKNATRSKKVPARKVTRTKQISKRATKRVTKRAAKAVSPLTQFITSIENLKPAGQVTPTHLLVLFAVGWAVMLTGIFFFFYSQTVLSFKVAPTIVAPSHLRNAYPVRVAVESVGINVSITPANIKDGIWQTSENTATYLENSARPAEGGNVIVYAHNKPHLFEPLHRIKVGDTIALTIANGSTYDYKVQEIKVVEPSAIEEVSPTDYEVLTIYTCTGFLDSKRLVVKALPTRVESL